MPTEYANPYVVAQAGASERTLFIRRTYLHLALAIAAFAGIEAFILSQSWAPQLAHTLSGSWMLVLGGFMVVSWISNKWAMSSTSKGAQYLGLGIFVAAEALLFLPLLYIAKTYDPDAIVKAGVMTGFLFGGITAFALITKADFSFLRGFITVASFVAMGFIVVSYFFGYSLGTLFSGAMVLLAGASVLYSTSNLIHQYRTTQYVAAALSLFAGVALMFYYILSIFMSRR